MVPGGDSQDLCAALHATSSVENYHRQKVVSVRKSTNLTSVDLAVPTGTKFNEFQALPRPHRLDFRVSPRSTFGERRIWHATTEILQRKWLVRMDGDRPSTSHAACFR
jgi:hypothetical protein